MVERASVAASEPRRFGDLTVVRLLGRGLMGEVFEAVNPRTNERFVVKTLRTHMRPLVDRKRFLREADVMRAIKHPNVMPIVRVNADADPPYYVMPFREGSTLQDRLAQRGRAPLTIVTRVARDVSFALSEIHRHGFVHRDIKPANLLIEASGRAVVLDFGLAKVLKDMDPGVPLTEVGAVLGTPAYMAPEQVRGESLDTRCDVYALGVVLIEMLLGVNPFHSDDVIETLRRQLENIPRRVDALMPHKVPTEMGELIHRMIQKDPKNRPSAGTCLETFAGLVRHQERNKSEPTRATVRPVVKESAVA